MTNTITYLQLPQGFGAPPRIVEMHDSQLPVVGDILHHPMEGPDNSYYKVVQVVRGTARNSRGIYENVVVTRPFSRGAVGTVYFD